MSDQKQGARLGELLDLKFKNQSQAGKAIGLSQGSIARWIGSEVVSDHFLKRYGPALQTHGLNPNYIRDETAPMTVDGGDEIQAIGDELEILKARASQLDARIKSLAQ